MKMSGPAGSSPPIQRKWLLSRSSARNKVTAGKAAKTATPIRLIEILSGRSLPSSLKNYHKTLLSDANGEREYMRIGFGFSGFV